MLAQGAGIAYNNSMQYTVRGISTALDRAIRQRARSEGKSLNRVTREALAEAVKLGNESVARRDVSDIVGTWRKEASVDAALAAQDLVDESLWK